MGIFKMPSTFSFLATWHSKKLDKMPLWKIYAYGAFVWATMYTGMCGNAYGFGFFQITTSTSAPVGIEQQLLSSLQGQYNVKITTNPLVSNTYGIVLYGQNPNYNAPPSYADVVKFSYPYGWADGESYQQSVTSNMLQSFMAQCSTPSVFVDTSIINTDSWNSDQCQEVLNAALQQNFNLQLSTPTTVPGDFQ